MAERSNRVAAVLGEDRLLSNRRASGLPSTPCRQARHDDRPDAGGDEHGKHNTADLADLVLDPIGRVETQLDLRQNILDLGDPDLCLLECDHTAPSIDGLTTRGYRDADRDGHPHR